MKLSLVKVLPDQQRIVAALLAAHAARTQDTVEDLRIFTANGGLQIIHTIETGKPHGRLRHVSISHADRYPTWDEIKAVRERFYAPTEDVMMVLPRVDLYVNLHPNCFHLWQMPFPWEYM